MNDLHLDAIPKFTDPGGLFANPMFMGEPYKSALYGVIHSNPGDIAGHHIVYAITPENQLEIKAVPLQHYPEGGKANVFDASDFVDPTGSGSVLEAWLPKLALSVALDQGLVTQMRFYPGKGPHKHWTCPLRQVLMWSAQMPEVFLPMVPNPLRAGRMYGKIMTPYLGGGTFDVHPTTKAIPMDFSTRISDAYWTTNGFCVYNGASAPSNEACALYSLARYTFSGEWSNYTTVFGSVCTDQVDWPYTPFYGRDSSILPGKCPSHPCPSHPFPYC